MVKKLISLAPKSATGIIKIFMENTLNAYINYTKVLQNKMPVTNGFLKAASSLDPRCSNHSSSLELMKDLPNYASNVISDQEREQYELEV